MAGDRKMKNALCVLLLLGVLLGLSGCGNWVENEYLSVGEHVEQPIPTTTVPEEEPQPVVTNRTELRGMVLSFIRDWTEQGMILVRDYDGDISADVTETLRYVMEEDPIGAYAVDYADAELNGDAADGSILLSIVFRRSSAEVDAIVTVNGKDAADQRIHRALSNFDSSLTLRIRNYTETDYVAEIREYCLANPDQIFTVPEVSAEVYPKEGETRILELHFLYPASRDEMRLMQNSVNTILLSSSSYVRQGTDEQERAELLFRFLTTRFQYTLSETEPEMPLYSLLCEGIAHSLSFANAFYAEGLEAELDCRIVSGFLNEMPYYWDMLRLDGEYYHVDLMRAVEQGESELMLLTDDELRANGYVWDELLYPASAVREENPDVQTDETTQPAEIEEPSEEATEPSSSEIP